MTKPWCIQYDGKWCASGEDGEPRRGGVGITTACDMFVMFYDDVAEREPDCVDCIEVLKLD